MTIEHYDVLAPIAAGLHHHETYVELGVSDGATFNRVAPLFTRRIAVDIRDDLGQYLIQPNEYVVGATDSFFLLYPDLKNVDLIFIDADHRHEFSMRDFNNAAKIVRPYEGLIALHDTYPVNEAGIAGGSWDTWKTAKAIRSIPDWEVVTLPVHVGLAICRYVPNGKHMDWQ